MIRATFALGLLLCPALAGAADPLPNPMIAVRADQWTQAAADAAQYADPVAQKLVTYYRLLAPGAATAQEITDFVTSSPDWPAQALLERRRQEAVAAEPDDAAVLAQCATGTLTLPAARLRCADALANAGHNAEALAEARAAWITFYPDADGFPQRWRAMMTPDDQWQRYEALAWTDAAAAARQVPLLDPAHRAAAEARIALQRDDPAAAARLAAVPAELTDDPALMLEQARWLRRANRPAAAVALWQQLGTQAEQAAPPAHRGAFWVERERLARDLLRTGDVHDAYTLVDQPGPIAPGQRLDAEFLAGFIALRLLHEPAAALPHFQALAAASPAAITQGRAWYWIARATAAAGQDANAAYAKAAVWPTTFYGQLAALALDDSAAALTARINALHDPPGTRQQALGLTQREVVRAAALLVAWGEPRRAEAFLLRMDELAPDLADRSLTAQLSLALRQPQTAVAIARRMGRDGSALPDAGWPMPVDPPPDAVDRAVVLGLIRQESSFDTATVSPAGARGLMQLMPATAATVARQIGAHVTLVALTDDPVRNMQLGTAYVRELMDHYNSSLPLVFAAYNAGPKRVDEWLAENGDPRVGPIDMIDWIELIPFAETRNYVQRVLENVAIYRAHRGETVPTLSAQWAR
ncbi:MAG TPA: lytic transglycosylase domain-containing protein [Acetobacteraceae bacterium]|jgi:soluble lytic murein transglycosylase|nr:lytic transglycosylase domain-containing protein [Acetobacteraceae bacterium]